MRFRLVVVVATLASAALSYAAVMGAQQPASAGRSGALPTPQRDGTAPAATGNGRLSGRVLAGTTNQPIYRAVVQLLTGNLQTSRWTSTDTAGRWSFADVPAGSYTIAASRDGYVSMTFGQRGAYGTPTPIVLGDRASADTLDITLLRGGVVTGRITDERGEPVGGVLVGAMRVRFVDGLRQLVEARAGMQSLLSGGLTDDRGEYRLYGLAPGTYYLRAGYGQSGQGRTDDRTTYAVTYDPGTASVSQASPIAVVADKVVSANFALVRTGLSMVSGRVVNSAGSPARGMVRLVPAAPGHAIEAGASTMSAQADTAGAFSIRGVPAGNYFIHVRPSGGPMAVSVTDGGVTVAGGPASNAMPEAAVVPLAVSGDDVRDLLIQTSSTASVTGTLRVEGTGPTAIADGFYVGTRALDSGATSLRGDFAGARTNATGAFAIPGVMGRHVIRLQSPKPGWWLKSVTVNGVDVTDVGVDFQGGQAVVVEVTVTQRMASVSGTVKDAAGKTAPDYSVVVFAHDDTKWVPYTRSIASAGSRQDATFTVGGLPAGDYVVVAVPPIEAGDETDPERLKAWRGVGQRVQLRDGESKNLALVLVKS